MKAVFVVFGKAPSIEELKNVTTEQAASFLELHPHVHLFEGESYVQDHEG